MRKSILVVLAVCATVFYSCQTESADSEDLNAVKIVAGIETEDGCLESSLAPIPDLASVCLNGFGPSTVTGAYWDVEVLDGALSGVYPGWCIDEDKGFANLCFNADVLSSYVDLSALPFEIADNFDSMNWLLNQEVLGTPSSDGTLFTYGDFQAAIWLMVEGEPCTTATCASLTDWSIDRANELVASALADGEGFVPLSGDITGIILVPENSQQMLLIPYKIECEISEPTCETAFAFSGDQEDCFINSGFKRWGWTIGPLLDGDSATYDVYAGAGKCDLEKGELVGTVDVSYLNGEVTVDYNIDASYDVTETHTYAGNEMFPTDKKGNPTVAPGQYSIEENLSGEVYVIAHAVVCK